MQFSFTHEIVFEEMGFFSSAIAIPSLGRLGLCFVQEIFRWMSLQIFVDHKICFYVSKISTISGDLGH